MKKIILVCGLLVCGQSSVVFAGDKSSITTNFKKEAVTVTVQVLSAGKPVKGALVKVVSLVGNITIGAGTTDEGGKAIVAIPTYNKQLISIQVSHSMFRENRLDDIALENGKTYGIQLKSRTESADEVTAESSEKVNKLEEKTVKNEEKESQYRNDAEKYAAEKEKAAASNEQLRKERDETEKSASEKQSAA
jgi:hypothetical protein